MKKKFGLHEPYIVGNEKKYLLSCIKDNWVSTSGKFLRLFEKEICKKTKAKFAVPVLNGTIGLHLSLILSKVNTNDEVLVPTITFAATVNSIIYLKAEPIFMDVDENFNIDEKKTIEFIKKKTCLRNGETINLKTKKKVKAIMIVHTFGNPANFENLYSLCKKRNIKIIEDAAESLGSVYKKGKFKNCHTGTIGDFGVFSFNGNKIITAGNGGILLTKNKNNYNKANYLITQSKDDNIRFIHNNVGYNYKLSNLSAALGLAQVEQLESFLKKKKEIRNLYKNYLRNSKNIELIDTPKYSKNNYWLNLIRIKTKKSILKVISELKKYNIDTRPIWQPNHLQLPFRKFNRFNLKNYKTNIKDVLCIPSSASLKKKDIKKISNIIKKICK